MQSTYDDYARWSHNELVDRVMHLESQLRDHTMALALDNESRPSPLPEPSTPAKKTKLKKAFDASRYTSHHIALKFAYLGKNYNGFEHHVNNTTPLTTIEEELWRALMKARLIFPTPRESRNGQLEELPEGKDPWEGPVNWTGTDYSKCGRTDKGVNAFGQVVAFKARSNMPLPKQQEPSALEKEAEGGPLDEGPGTEKRKKFIKPYDPIRDEIDYPAILNRILPPDIRVLAWCPSPSPNFSARFSCKERRYKYFFTQPAYLPTPRSGAQAKSAFLDIDRMMKAASYLIGAHDFRNFCKVDASKQITNFVRRITHASIDEVWSPDVPSFFNSPVFGASATESKPMKVYTFSLHGTAFLWHQVRCIMAVLFMVGQRLEEPEIIKHMFDMSEASEGRPRYEMANEAPLVLWDCIFPLRVGDDDGKPYDTGEHIEDAIPWRYTGGRSATGGAEVDTTAYNGHWGRNSLMDGLWRQWRGHKMDEILSGALLDKAAATGIPTFPFDGLDDHTTLIFDGSDGSRAVGRYVPLMKRERMEPVEVVNARFAAKKGLNGHADESMDIGE